MASPWKRIGAALVDFGLIWLVAFLVETAGESQGLKSNFDIIVLSIYLGYHAGFVHWWEGQTPGRRAFEVLVVSAGGSSLGIIQAIGRPGVRVVCFLAVVWIGFRLGGLEPALVLFAALPLLDLGLLFLVPSRQTLADLVCRTVVVAAPPLQPHRAPAAPMYSAKDAEFGVRPQKRRRTTADH